MGADARFGRGQQVNSDGCWNFNGSTTNEALLRPLCQQVETTISIPGRRLYRYFAISDDPNLALDIGPYYKGFNAPASTKWPWYLESERNLFDYLIYIRQATCFDPVGCTITYAHEIQHVVQHGLYPRLLKVNQVLRNRLADFKPTATEVDLPTEVDANIASKRVGKLLCGESAVRTFAEGQLMKMRAAGATEQVVRWEFFLQMPSAIDYDPVAATVKLVQEYKGRIDFGMDVEKPEWWLGPEDVSDTAFSGN